MHSPSHKSFNLISLVLNTLAIYIQCYGFDVGTYRQNYDNKKRPVRSPFRGEEERSFEPAGVPAVNRLHREEQCVAVAINQQQNRIVVAGLAGLADRLAEVANVSHRLMIHLLNHVARL